jgi:PncC family amidohydrolase
MAKEHLLPALVGDKVLLQKGVWTWNWSEGAQRDALQNLAFPASYQFSSLPGERGVRLSLQTLVPKAEASLKQTEFDSAWQAILAAIPAESLVHPEGLSLPETVQELLLARKATVSVAESCTGGGLGQLLTDTAGSSAVFHRGFLTYSNQAKVDLLGVPEDILKSHGAVSEETAKAMVSGCLERSGSTYACAITGIAGPEGGTADKPVGTVWIAIAHRDSSAPSGSPIRIHARRFQFRGDRHAVRQRSAFMALNQIRLLIQGRLG